MKQCILFLVLGITCSAIASKPIGGGKYRKMFDLPGFDCRQSCIKKVTLEGGFTYVLMGKPDGDEFEIRACKGNATIMFQRFSSAGIKSYEPDDSFRSYFKGTVKLNDVLEDIFGIKFKRGKPYLIENNWPEVFTQYYHM